MVSRIRTCEDTATSIIAITIIFSTLTLTQPPVTHLTLAGIWLCPQKAQCEPHLTVPPVLPRKACTGGREHLFSITQASPHPSRSLASCLLGWGLLVTPTN